RALKVGQRVYLKHHSKVEEVVVTEVTERHVQVQAIPSAAFAEWWENPDHTTKPPEYNATHGHGYAVDFTFDGKPLCLWGWVDAWRPILPNDHFRIVGL